MLVVQYHSLFLPFLSVSKTWVTPLRRSRQFPVSRFKTVEQSLRAVCVLCVCKKRFRREWNAFTLLHANESGCVKEEEGKKKKYAPNNQTITDSVGQRSWKFLFFLSLFVAVSWVFHHSGTHTHIHIPLSVSPSPSCQLTISSTRNRTKRHKTGSTVASYFWLTTTIYVGVLSVKKINLNFSVSVSFRLCVCRRECRVDGGKRRSTGPVFKIKHIYIFSVFVCLEFFINPPFFVILHEEERLNRDGESFFFSFS